MARAARGPTLDDVLAVWREDYRREEARVLRAGVEAMRALGLRHLEIVR